MNSKNFATVALVALSAFSAACGSGTPRFESFSVDNSQCTTTTTAYPQVDGVFSGTNDEEVTTYKFKQIEGGYIEPKEQVPTFDGQYSACLSTVWNTITLDVKSLPKTGTNFSELLDDAGLVLSDRSSVMEDICIYASDGEDAICLGCSNFDPIPLNDLQRRVQIKVGVEIPRGTALKFSIWSTLRPQATNGLEITVVSLDAIGTDGKAVSLDMRETKHSLSLQVEYY